MSTWETESFRGEHFQSVAAIPDATEYGWEKFVELTSVPFNGGEFKSHIWQGSRPGPQTEYYPVGEAKELLHAGGLEESEFRRIFWSWANDRVSRRRSNGDWDILMEVMDTYNDVKWIPGLSAVHELGFNPDRWLKRVDADAYKFVLTFTREAMVGLCEAPRYRPDVAEDQFHMIDGSSLEEFAKNRMMAEEMRAVYKMRFANRQRNRNADGTTTSRFLAPGVKLFYIGSLTLLVKDKKVLVLTMSDCDRAQQMLVSKSMLHLYLATVNSGGSFPYTELRNAILLEYDELKRVCTKSSYADAQRICKFYKKAMDLYQSYLAGVLSDGRRIELQDDVRDAPKEFDPFAFVVRLRKRSLETAQESGKIYRILCAPDYDIGESYLKRAKQLNIPNPKGEHIHKNVPLNMDEFRKYHASTIIMAAVRMNGGKGIGKPFNDPPSWWDKWLLEGRAPAGLNWVDEFNWEGTVNYRDRDETDPDVWKDSTTCEEEWKDVMSERENSKTMPRNMLTRLLRDNQCPTPATARVEITRGLHLLRAGFKMEAHKDVARIFYIGNLQDRLFGSEIEQNITRVATHVSGFTVGAPIADIVRRIGRCYSPDVMTNQEVYHFSSDFEAWSPGMHGDVQRMSHSNWAQLFGRPDIRNQKYINEESWLLLNKRGYKGAVQNIEANYEGLNGKEMTVLHCAFVGYTIYRARLGGLKIPVADFAAFIDDGALTIALPKDPTHAVFKSFFEYFKETTAYLGFKLDAAKCYLSTRFLIYLNEVYYGGRHIAHGLRAVMRIGTRDAKRGETITDILEAAGAGCRGAAKCGISAVQIWKCCIIVHAIEMYIRYSEDTISARAMVLFTYAPRILGGLQAPIGLTLDCNFSGSGATESMAYIKTYTKYNSEVRQWFCKIARTDVKQCSGATLVRNYRTVTPAGPGIAADYISPEIRLALDGFVKSDFGQQLALYGTVRDDVEIGEAILKNTPAISATVLAAIDKSLISSVFAGFLKKFESSSTMQKILGPARLYRIERRIVVDELEYAMNFRRRVISN